MAGWLPQQLGACCVDIACGAGEMLYALKAAGYSNIEGIDISPEQVAQARTVCASVGEGDAIAFLRARPRHYDLITALNVIEHFGKDEVFELLEVIHAALRPGGRLILQTPNAESPWGLTMRYGDLTHEICYSPRSLAQLLLVFGFEQYAARECCPHVHGPASFFRWVAWRCLAAGCLLWNLVEMGDAGERIYTRVFVASARRGP